MQNDLLPLAALVASLAVAVILATVVVTPIYLTSSGPYSTKQHTIYITTTTLLATTFTAFITSQVRKLLLRQIDGELHNAYGIRSLNKRRRVILKIGSPVESVRYPAIAMIYLLASLVTTAVVAGLTPDLRTRSFPLQPQDLLWTKYLRWHIFFDQSRKRWPAILLGLGEWKRLLYTG